MVPGSMMSTNAVKTSQRLIAYIMTDSPKPRRQGNLPRRPELLQVGHWSHFFFRPDLKQVVGL